MELFQQLKKIKKDSLKKNIYIQFDHYYTTTILL